MQLLGVGHFVRDSAGKEVKDGGSEKKYSFQGDSNSYKFFMTGDRMRLW